MSKDDNDTRMRQKADSKTNDLRDNIDQPAQPPNEDSRLRDDDADFNERSAPLYENPDHK